MEERIIDDEFGKGVRLKKTKDGYVLADDAEETAETAEDGEEVSFEFPTFEVEAGEEDLIGLSPEEVEKYRKQRAEEAALKRAQYEEICRQGEKLLEEKSYKAAELEFDKALSLDDEPTEASVGYWRAKTADFTQPDVLMSEYEDLGVENLEYDLGYKAVEVIKAEYKSVFEKRYAELLEEEKPLKEEVESKQAKRREYLKERFKKASIIFGVSVIPLLVCAILTVVFGLKIPTTPDARYVAPTIALGIGTIAFFIVFVVCFNRFFNALRIYTKNERLDSTEAGARLVQIGLYKELYEYFLTNMEEEEVNE